MTPSIRPEVPGDYAAVEALVREAFWNVYQPGCYEHHYLHLLRRSLAFRGNLTFVCEAEGRPAGYLACSSSSIALCGGGRLETITFGPLAVLPALQKQGLARALVCHALRAARAMGERAAVILGDPRHYGRYGFWCGEKWGISLEDGQYLPGLQAVELQPGALRAAAGRFQEGFVYQPDEAELDAFDAAFPPKEKAVTPSQQEFAFMCSLGHQVIPNGFM
ncbi:MAG TPA: N-acetyltransferase [Candidatus Flavonifractor intestinipullorum]|uniref:N-acetyltransferase n=1 Tax=Candidatus Flavonifractor intestinipullorum TaxID=2838587 RepID=A0A9D2MCB1_9FIRM|nr:N-acetyltransferase [Candidatus Flavonifractor intestinipullorum]